MFRIKLHRLNDGAYRVTHGSYQKHFISKGLYQLLLAIKCVYRDLLYANYGSQWQLMEIHHQKSIRKSMTSALKRMK